MDTIHVKNVYETIANHFSDTRYSHWKCVRDFLDLLSPLELVGDIGCGNGKNMLYRKDLRYIGCDITENLVSIAKQKTGNEIILASGTDLPFHDNLFDACMSVAVIHHLTDSILRKKFVQEMVRCTKNGGLIMFTVWMLDQPYKKKWEHLGNGDFFIPWNNKNSEILQRFYHFFTESEVLELITDDCVLEKIVSECYNYIVILRKIRS